MHSWAGAPPKPWPRRYRRLTATGLLAGRARPTRSRAERSGWLAQPQLIIEGIFFSDFKGKLASTRFLSDRGGASLSSPGAIEDLRTPDADASRGVELRGFRQVGIAALVVDP